MQFQKYVFACEITSQHTHLIDYRVSKVWMLGRLFLCWSLFLFDFIICHSRKKHSHVCVFISVTYICMDEMIFIYFVHFPSSSISSLSLCLQTCFFQRFEVCFLSHTQIFSTHIKKVFHISAICVFVCVCLNFVHTFMCCRG